MNNINKLKLKNEIGKLLRFHNKSGSHWNCYRYSTANTYEHEMRKFQVFMELRKRNIDVMTEVIFQSGGRADVLTSEGIVYEILHTESEEKFKEKLNKYPQQLELRIIKTSDKWNEKLLD